MKRQDILDKQQHAMAALHQAIDSWEVQNRASANDFNRTAVGLSKDKVERIEADLDLLQAELRSFDRNEAARKSENEPQYDTRKLLNSSASNKDDAESAAFYNALRTGDASFFKRTMVVGPAGAAPTGVQIPNPISTIIREKMNQNSIMRQISTVYTVDGALKIPIEDALPTTYFLAESAEVTASDPTFGTSVQVTPYRFATKTVLTNEFLSDAQAGSGMDYVARKVGESMSLKQNSYFMNGTNSTQPQGVATSTQAALGSNAQVASDLAGGAVSTIDGADIIDLYFKLKQPYRANGSFLMSDTALKAIRSLKDTANQYIYRLGEDTGGLNLGMVGTLMGRPVYTDPDFNTTTTDGLVAAVFGDFSGYEIFDRPTLEMLIDPFTFAQFGQTILYTTSRMDAKIPQREKFVFTTV